MARNMTNTDSWKRVVFFTDEHRPYHHGPAVDLSLQIIRDYRPDILVTGSDGLDFRSISRYSKNSALLGTLEKVERLSFFDGVREKKSAWASAEIWFIAGNHERRYDRYVQELGELALNPDLQLWKWLRLDALSVKYNLDTKVSDIDGVEPEIMIASRFELSPKLTIMHGDYIRKHSGWSAKAQLIEGERMQTSVLVGHCHRGGYYLTADARGVPIGAWECFHHQRIDMPWLKGLNPNWQWGLTMVEVQIEEPYYFAVEQVHYVPVRKGMRARWRGREYTSS